VELDENTIGITQLNQVTEPPERFDTRVGNVRCRQMVGKLPQLLKRADGEGDVVQAGTEGVKDLPRPVSVFLGTQCGATGQEHCLSSAEGGSFEWFGQRRQSEQATVKAQTRLEAPDRE